MRGALILTAILAASGCGGPAGPPSTTTSSDALPTLDARVEFHQRYVRFRRSYRDLGFRIRYQDGGSGPVPSPSEWDIRIVAAVPPDELAAWIPPGVKAVRNPDLGWLKEVPGGDRASGISEWHEGRGLLVGVDRKNAVVAYRASRS